MSFEWLDRADNFCSRHLNKDEISPFLSRFENPTFIGSGGYKDVWAIDEEKVLIIHQSREWLSEHQKCKKIWDENKPWSAHEPRVYDAGVLSEGFFWSIMERFKIIETKDWESEIDDALYEIIIQVDNAVYDIFLDRDLLDNGVTVSQLNEDDYAKALELSRAAAFRINLCDQQNEKVVKVADFFGLASDWLERLTDDLSYKTMTERYGDLHSCNLGFRLSDMRPVFFDW